MPKTIDDRVKAMAKAVVEKLKKHDNLSLNTPHQLPPINFREGEKAAQRSEKRVLGRLEQAFAPFIKPELAIDAAAKEIFAWMVKSEHPKAVEPPRKLTAILSRHFTQSQGDKLRIAELEAGLNQVRSYTDSEGIDLICVAALKEGAK